MEMNIHNVKNIEVFNTKELETDDCSKFCARYIDIIDMKNNKFRLILLSDRNNKKDLEIIGDST